MGNLIEMVDLLVIFLYPSDWGLKYQIFHAVRVSKIMADWSMDNKIHPLLQIYFRQWNNPQIYSPMGEKEDGHW